MKIRNLNKAYGDNTVFKDFSIDFIPGKVNYIMGKSGIGKTTLLRIISGLDKDFTGEIDYCGKLAYVFQEPRLFPSISVLQNLLVVNDSSKYSARKLLEIVELNGCENMLPEELSGGMKMRLAIARALYYEPDVILMDEPFASIDYDMKKRITQKVFELLNGKTVIIVSHDADDAKTYADNIINI